MKRMQEEIDELKGNTTKEKEKEKEKEKKKNK